jgi:hypothetical protein
MASAAPSLHVADPAALVEFLTGVFEELGEEHFSSGSRRILEARDALFMVDVGHVT